MTFSYEIYPEQCAIVTRYRGRFSLADLQRSAKGLWSDPRYVRDYVGLVDLSDPSVGASMQDFRAIVAFVREHGQASVGRWAAVASSPFATACALLYRTAVADRHAFEVFSTWEAACAFLDVKIAPDAPLQVLMTA